MPASGSGRPAGRPAGGTDAAVLYDLLVVEYGVIYGYGVAGGVAAAQLDPGRPPAPAVAGTIAQATQLAAAGLDVHRTRRDLLADRIRGLHARMPEPLPAYRLPSTPHDAATALRLLAQLEDRVALANHRALTVAATPAIRDFAAGTLADAAVRGMRARLAAGDPPAAALKALPGS